jgi:hypothetical protein
MAYDLNFDSPPPRRGISFQWWIGDARMPVPHGGPQDGAVRAWILSTSGFKALPRHDQPQAEHPDVMLPYTGLEYELLSGDTLRLGTTVRVAYGKEDVLVAMTWTLARAPATIAVAPPPKPADPCGVDARAPLIRQDRPSLQSVGSSEASGGAARVEPPRQTNRVRLTELLACYPEALPLLRAFYHNGVLTSGVDDRLAEQLLAAIGLRGASAADRQAQLLTLHESLLANADASKVARELFAEPIEAVAPLARLEAEVVPIVWRAPTWTEALRHMDRHLKTGASDAMVEARTEATLFLFSRRGQWSNVRIVQAIAAFAPPLVGTAAGMAAPLFDDLPAAKTPPRPFDEAAPGYVDYVLDKTKQVLGFLDLLGVPGAKDVAASTGRIKSGVKMATGRATLLDGLKEALDALPQDDAIKAAKGSLGNLTTAYAQLASIAAEPDRLISNTRYETTLQHFAERTASLPQIQGWIAAAGDETRRTTAAIIARRDTITQLRSGVERRFGRSYEQMAVECTPNLDCFTPFADYKVRLEEQQYHIAHLVDERAANLIEQRSLCWRVGQRGGTDSACAASRK